MHPRRRGIIIDASIARAAGESQQPVSNKCRAFLEEVRTVCHHVVTTRESLEEWNQHRSRFSQAWLRSMHARKKVDELEMEADERLRTRVGGAARNQQERDGMLKDIHLIEAALKANAPVVSLDENTARGPFRCACRTVRRLQAVVWVNPTADSESPLDWLRNGAGDDDFRCLGFEVEEQI